MHEIQLLDMFDWECEKEDTRYLTHDYHPYPSKYIPQIPRNLITVLSNEGDVVLDCFVGSGTTLVECRLLGRNGIGVDINPLAILISKVKSTPIDPKVLKPETEKLVRKIYTEIKLEEGNTTIQSHVLAERSYTPKYDYKVPYPSFIKYWFQPQVIKELVIIKNNIDSVDNEDVRDFFLVAFSSILRGVSNAASGYGNLMRTKNPPVKKRIFEKFRSKLYEMVSRMVEFNIAARGSVEINLVKGNAKNLHFLRQETIDLICTHPPYMSSVPYAEYQKLSLWWLGYEPRKLDAELIGGRRSRKDAATRYLEDMDQSFKEMCRVLRTGRYCCVVIGNPKWRGRIWPLNELLTEIAEKHGFKLIKEISRGKYKMTMGKMKREYILVFRK